MWLDFNVSIPSVRAGQWIRISAVYYNLVMSTLPSRALPLVGPEPY